MAGYQQGSMEVQHHELSVLFIFSTRSCPVRAGAGATDRGGDPAGGGLVLGHWRGREGQRGGSRSRSQGGKEAKALNPDVPVRGVQSRGKGDRTERKRWHLEGGTEPHTDDKGAVRATR